MLKTNEENWGDGVTTENVLGFMCVMAMCLKYGIITDNIILNY